MKTPEDRLKALIERKLKLFLHNKERWAYHVATLLEKFKKQGWIQLNAGKVPESYAVKALLNCGYHGYARQPYISFDKHVAVVFSINSIAVFRKNGQIFYDSAKVMHVLSQINSEAVTG